MNWAIIILYHLMSALLSCGAGLMVVVIVERIFEQIAGYVSIKHGSGLSQAELEQELEQKLKQDIERVKNPRLLYELKALVEIEETEKPKLLEELKNLVEIEEFDLKEFGNQKVDKLNELVYELKLLLAAKRMVGWWKILVLLIVMGVVYYQVF